MTRFLNVNVFLDPQSGGGTAERTRQLSRAIAAAGARTTVLCLDIGLTPERLQPPGAVRVIALPCLQRRFLIPRVNWSAMLRLVGEADVIQLTSHWTALNALVYAAARRLGKPWIVCPAGALPVFGRSALLKRLYNGTVGRRIIAEAAGWVAITSAERAQFGAYGVAEERVQVIPNGVRMDEFAQRDVGAFRARHGLGTAPFILFVGRLSPIKGPDILLEAFGRIARTLQHSHLVFAGPDEGMRPELERQARSAGIAERVHFTGYLEGTEKSSAYHAAELVAVPSRLEAMSIVALEAGACSKPVVLTDTCGFGEIQDAGGGRVVGVNADAMAVALEEMLRDRSMCMQMGRRLRDLVEARYTWSASAQRYTALFDALRGVSRCAS
jgi:glycosyltransferase involved in cell wall biosynthesis